MRVKWTGLGDIPHSLRIHILLESKEDNRFSVVYTATIALIVATVLVLRETTVYVWQKCAESVRGVLQGRSNAGVNDTATKGHNIASWDSLD